jgi:hypothetical protein
MREVRNLSHGIARARKAKERAHLRASRPRFQLEQLETRVLLFSPLIGPSIHLVELGGFTPQATISFTAPATPSFTAPATPSYAQEATILPPTGQIGQVGTTSVLPVHLAVSTENGAPVLFVLGRGAPGGGLVVGPDFAQTSQSLEPSPGVSPFVALAQHSSQPALEGFAAPEFAGAGYGRPMLAEAYALSLGSGAAEGGIGLASSPNIDIAPGGLSMPLGIHDSVAGALVAGKPWSMQVPIESPYDSFLFTVHGTDESAPSPGFGSVGVFDSAGNPLFQGDLLGLGAGPLQAFNLSLRGGPAGGHLVVSLSMLGNSTTTESGTTGVSAASINSGLSVPFVVTVQRLDVQDPASAPTGPAQGPLAVGTVALAASSVPGVPAGADSPGQQSTVTTVDSSQSSSDEPAPVLTADGEPASESADGFNLRLPTGPFASRNAGPLGPILASVGGDPTPEVDRLERALFQEIERRDAETGIDQDEARSALTHSDSGEDRLLEPGSPVAAVAGAGASPLELTALSRTRRTDLHGLLSAIAPAAVGADAAEGPAVTAHWIDPRQIAVITDASPRRVDVPPYADFIKAACGVALGLGMSSRALFPDLLSSMKKRALTRLRTVRSKAPRR